MQQAAPVKIDVACDVYMTRHYIFENVLANTTPQRFGVLGEKGFLFSRSWRALFIIFSGVGEQAHTLGDLGSTAN